jgi:predicted  nucleic acid-binding Zn-ribbon protein
MSAVPEIDDVSMWEMAMKDAKSEIEEIGTEIDKLVRRKKRLQQAIRIFAANKQDGIKWPR